MVMTQWTLRWFDGTGQEVVATPKMQALAEAQIVVLKEIFLWYSTLGLRLTTVPGFENILSTLPSLLLEAADLPCSCLALEELNFALACEQHHVQVTLDGILTILKEVVKHLTEEQAQESED